MSDGRRKTFGLAYQDGRNVCIVTMFLIISRYRKDNFLPLWINLLVGTFLVYTTSDVMKLPVIARGTWDFNFISVAGGKNL